MQASGMLCLCMPHPSQMIGASNIHTTPGGTIFSHQPCINNVPCIACLLTPCAAARMCPHAQQPFTPKQVCCRRPSDIRRHPTRLRQLTAEGRIIEPVKTVEELQIAPMHCCAPVHTFMFDCNGQLLKANKAAIGASRNSMAGELPTKFWNGVGGGGRGGGGGAPTLDTGCVRCHIRGAGGGKGRGGGGWGTHS